MLPSLSSNLDGSLLMCLHSAAALAAPVNRFYE
jgi:hypothetical protein